MIETMVADLAATGTVPGLAPGDPAPDFDLPDADGVRVRSTTDWPPARWC